MSGVKRALAAVCALLLAAGCAPFGPDYRRAAVKLPASYADGAPASPAAIGAPANWWRLYGDPLLDKLVAQGLEGNSEVSLAVARIDEAEAYLREVNAATFLPQIDGIGGASRAQTSTRTGTLPPNVTSLRNNFELGVRTSFEIDVWGRLRRTREAAHAQFLATRYARDVVALTLAATIAQGYFNVRALDAQIAVSRDTLGSAVATLEIARSRARAGLVSELDVNQSDANRAQLAAQLADLQRQRAAGAHQLGLLSGTPGLEVPSGDLRALPSPPLPPAGLPASLLERRPDLAQAEAALIAANAQIGVARAAQFPTFSLTAALGAQSRELSTLLSSGAGIWSMGLGVVGPIFDSGRYAARTEQAEARARQAAANYEKAARNAFREVADALSNVQRSGEAQRDLETRAARALETLRLARLRYEAGYSGYLEVLDATRTANDAALALVRNRQAHLVYTVDLMNALGGGWVPY